MSSHSVGKDSITPEEVMSNLYSKELRLKASMNGDEVSMFGFSVTDSTKG